MARSHPNPLRTAPAGRTSFLLVAALVLGCCCPWFAAPSGHAAEGPAAIAIERPAPDRVVSFHRDILPLLQPNCLPCHNRTASKGDLNLESPSAMQRGGESGPALVPGKAAESLLLKVSTHEVKPRMPPRDNKVNAVALTPPQLGLLAAWIDQGAVLDPESAAGPVIAWQTVPTNVIAIYATALSPDGRLAAAGRGNRIHLHATDGTFPARRLEDPALGDGAAQRDVVNALAFSPDGHWLAAGGYREARLWHLTEPTPTPVPLPRPDDTTDSSLRLANAALSPDGTRAALLRPGGVVEVIRLDTRSVEARLDAGSPAPSVLRFSDDRRWLAAGNPAGRVQLWACDGGSNAAPASLSITLSNAVTALAFLDGNRQLAVSFDVPPGTPDSVVVLQRSEATPPALTRTRSLPARSVVGVVADTSRLGAGNLVATGSADGWVRLWSTDPAKDPVSLDVGTPVTGLVVLPGAPRIAVATRNGGTRIWSLEGTPKVVATLAGDPRLAAEAGAAERSLAFARSEVEYHKAALQRNEGDLKKRTEESAKAVEKHQANEKALAEKQKNLADEEAKRAQAEKDKTEFEERLARSKEAFEKARTAAEAARTAAREASERQSESRLAADQAARSRADLERVLADLTGKADDATLTRAREAAAQAAQGAEARSKSAQEARAAAEKAIDTLATLASGAGESKASADRAQAELPPRIKDATDRQGAAAKAIESLKPQLDRARIQRDTSADDVQLAQRNLESVRKAIEETKAAQAGAERLVVQAEALQRQTAGARDAANASGHPWLALSPDGGSLLTLDDAQRLVLWSTSRLEAQRALPLPPAATLPMAWSPGLPASKSGSEPRPDRPGLVFASGDDLAFMPFEGSWRLAHVLTKGAGPAAAAMADRVTALAFSPDSRRLATGGGEPSRSSEIRIWSVADGGLIRDLGSPHSDTVLGLAFSPDGHLLASGGADRFLRLLDPRTGAVLRNFEGHTHHVMAVAWKADGRVLASAGAEGTVKLWNRITGERLRNVEGFGKEVSGIHGLGIAAEFLAVSGAGQARVFKEDGNQVRTLPANGAFLTSLSVTPDGRLAVAGSDDGILRAWVVPDGKSLAEWR